MLNNIPDLSFSNKLLPKKGRILLSDPFLGDEYFERSVVYICEHSKDGSFGFVLNNYLELPLQQLNEKFPSIMVKVSIGGPVEKETLYFMHTLGKSIDDSLLIDNELYMGGDFTQLYDLIDEKLLNDCKIRFFIGYSGWGKNQLQDEINNNAWIVVNVESIDEVMNIQTNDLWKYFMEKQGEKYKIISQFPKDPSEN
jgi:putative transcriptional regulator